MAEERIDYVDDCPTCKSAGRDEKLGFDLKKGEICCRQGHVFDAIPKATVPEKAPIATAAPEPAGNDFEAAARSPEPVEEVLPAKERDRARMDEIVAKRAEKPPSLAVMPKPQTDAGLLEPGMEEGTTRALPGGDLLLVVRIPERLRQAVEAEAEGQNQATAAYFQNWVEEGLANYWENAPAAK